MSHSFEPLVPGKLSFTDSGVPFSEAYQDLYHSKHGAVEQAQYVFLSGNDLPNRWRGRASFTVCETGFGLGRNFLALWRAWLDDPSRCERLHMVSFEAHPFSKSDLARALPLGLPRDLQELGEQLIDQWPPLLPGLHRLEFENGRITLTLAFGRIERLASQVEACADAFFLDGFAPAKNPEMWTRALFGQLVRIASKGATAASWCVAGAVRRNLADAGFIVSKEPGFGTKREMLKARLREGLGRHTTQNLAANRHIAIVGGSIAAAGIAHALAIRGQAVTVVDPLFAHTAATSHHGHVSAALSPLVSRDDDIRVRLVRAGVLRALHRWQALGAESGARPRVAGTLEIITEADQASARERDLAQLAFPEQWVQWLDEEAVRNKVPINSGRPALFYPLGQLVRPDALIKTLLDHPLIERRAWHVDSIGQREAGWQLKQGQSVKMSTDVLILANGYHALPLLDQASLLKSLPKAAAMHRLAGQVAYLKAPSKYSMECIVSGRGYWLPEVGGINTAGSTYERGLQLSQLTDVGREVIFGKLGLLINATHQELAGLLAHEGGWAGWRAVVPGRMPLAGPVKEAKGLWLACAYGSRGFTWSPVVGDVIGAALFSEPQVIERDLIQAIAPR